MKNVCMDYPSYESELSLDYSTPYLNLGDSRCLNEYKSLMLNSSEQKIINNALDDVVTIFSESVNCKKDIISDERIYVSFYKEFKGVLFVRLMNTILKCDNFDNRLKVNMILNDGLMKTLCKKLDFSSTEELKKHILEFLENSDLVSFVNTTMIYNDLNPLECLNFFNSIEFNNIYDCVKNLVVNKNLGDTAFKKEEFLKFLSNPEYSVYFKLFLKSIQFIVKTNTDRSAVGIVNSSFNFYAFDALGYGDIFSRELYSTTAPSLYPEFVDYLNKPGVLANYDLCIKSEFNSLVIDYMSSNGYGTNYATVNYFCSYVYYRLFNGVISNKDISYLDVIRRKL